ncbi:hypothetical protein DFH06DRAFT_1410920 [Mycena polygramma]|nr:hypothetical protein DFH06DRAFT_1410920 [Mycena polygramma]
MSREHSTPFPELFLQILQPIVVQGRSNMRKHVSHEFRCPDILAAALPILINGELTLTQHALRPHSLLLPPPTRGIPAPAQAATFVVVWPPNPHLPCPTTKPARPFNAQRLLPADSAPTSHAASSASTTTTVSHFGRSSFTDPFLDRFSSLLTRKRDLDFWFNGHNYKFNTLGLLKISLSHSSISSDLTSFNRAVAFQSDSRLTISLDFVCALTFGYYDLYWPLDAETIVDYNQSQIVKLVKLGYLDYPAHVLTYTCTTEVQPSQRRPGDISCSIGLTTTSTWLTGDRLGYLQSAGFDFRYKSSSLFTIFVSVLNSSKSLTCEPTNPFAANANSKPTQLNTTKLNSTSTRVDLLPRTSNLPLGSFELQASCATQLGLGSMWRTGNLNPGQLSNDRIQPISSSSQAPSVPSFPDKPRLQHQVPFGIPDSTPLVLIYSDSDWRAAGLRLPFQPSFYFTLFLRAP